MAVDRAADAKTVFWMRI